MDVKQRREHKIRVAEQAAQWLDTLTDARDSDRAAFIEWVLESRMHLEQFLLMSAVGREGKKVDAAAFDINGLLAKAGGNVVGLSTDAVNMAPLKDSRLLALNRKRAFGLAAGLAGIAMALGMWWVKAPKTLTTDVGEQRTVALMDGSTLYLSAQSEVKIRYTARERNIDLNSGEAMFKVRRDAARPFRVRAGDTIVQAIGTQFDVHRRLSGTTVSVIEGVVQIASAPSQPRLAAGEEVRIGADGEVARRPAATAAAERLPWHRPRLSFDEDTLEDIAADFNRFNRTPKLRIEGEELGQHRFTGTFNADDPLSLIAFIEEYAAVDVRQAAGVIVIRGPRPKSK